MSLGPGDRVRLARSGKTGRIVSMAGDGAIVQLDNGIRTTFPLAVLAAEGDGQGDVEGKSWPPVGIETK